MAQNMNNLRDLTRTVMNLGFRKAQGIYLLAEELIASICCGRTM
jgi:hypothetical protein